MAKMSIIELRRTGAGQLTQSAIRFDWDSQTHSMMQGDLSFSLMVKTVREEPAGADEPVEQVLSATWQPFDFEGEWSDRWAGKNFAMDTFREFSRLVGRASLVRLTIDKLSFVGLLTNLDIVYRTADQIRWRCKISPHRNEAVGSFRPEVFQIVKPISQRAAETAEIADNLEATSEAGQAIDAKTEDLVEVSDQVELMSAASDQVTSISSGGLTDDPQRTLFSLVASFRRVREVGQEITTQLGSKRADLICAYDDAIMTLKAEEWLRNTYVDALRAIGHGKESEDDIRGTAEKRPIAIHRCADGDTYERVSKRYYGTPDAWRLIYDANQADSLVLSGGTELLIPARAA